jgi:hypothetical protein
MSRVCSVFGSLLVILDGKEGLNLQRDAPELLPLAGDINDSLVPIGLEIPYLKAANLSFS